MRSRVRDRPSWVAVGLMLVVGLSVSGMEAPVGAVQPQEEFVPIDQLPPDDQLPAAPLLVAAYGIVWVVVFGYLWSIWKRQGTIARELDALAKRAGTESGKPS